MILAHLKHPSFLQHGIRRPYFLARKKYIGEGQEGEVYSATIMGKNGLRHVVEKNITFNRSDQRKRLVRAKRNWAVLKKLGIPVPKFYTILIRKADLPNGGVSVLMENLSKRFGRIRPINNEMGEPVFLSRLRLGRDKKLLTELASDLAAIHNAGYRLAMFDLWGIYKKPNGTYGRVAMDYGTMYEAEESVSVDQRDVILNSAISLMREAKRFLGRGEFAHFLSEYNKRANEKVP
jgi:hypothetical protein